MVAESLLESLEASVLLVVLVLALAAELAIGFALLAVGACPDVIWLCKIPAIAAMFPCLPFCGLRTLCLQAITEI
jgi:hypothetical protein